MSDINGRADGMKDIGNTVAIGGLTCSLSVRTCSGTQENDKLAPHHHFAYFRELQPGRRLATYGSFDGGRPALHRLHAQDSFFLPMGHRWTSKSRGSATIRMLECDLEPSALVQAFGDRAGRVQLEPQIGANPIGPGVFERLERLCLEPNVFPRSYADALAVIFIHELVRACAPSAFPAPETATIGKARFRPVLDHIEDSLESDTSLADLAALTGLSVSHFSRAFNSAYGVAPHRYILRRRIDKAKRLLRTSDKTIAAVSAHVGFSSQSRFAQMFSRQTGLTPSAYRSEHSR
jgi:AraC family transcriptional regulator